jgi:alginate O-acetyltransferase complex protein AlgI
MLFYSYEFLSVFLPLTAVGFFWAARHSRGLAIAWLALASLAFYGYWNPRFVVLMIVSVTFNFMLARYIAARVGSRVARLALWLGVAVNLAILGYFKYTNFFVSSANWAFGTRWAAWQVVLPLGVSVFTFTQIAFLNDVRRGLVREYRYLHYLLFVAYFPHLIAGPIIHHGQIMPQLADPANYQAKATNISIGLVTFTIGLAKKVLLAGSFAEYADPIFAGTAGGLAPGLLVAWFGTLAYTLQIYFDFSGYSDMAIGLSRLFGIRLPENFDSPYKACSIIDFWRRWNMTLSQFLRDYLYIPLGGNRRGKLRRYVNMLLTMLLGGLWHGASWTFVVWGGLHGLYLVINHAWRSLGLRSGAPGWPLRLAATGLTFLAVMFAWIFFRADSLETAARMLGGLASWRELAVLPGLSAPQIELLFTPFWLPQDGALYFATLLCLGMALIWLAPNTAQIVTRMRISTPRAAFLTIGAALFWIYLLATISISRGVSQFIYFNF